MEQNNGIEQIMVACLPNDGISRIIKNSGKLYFCGVDVAKSAGYEDPFMAIRTECSDMVRMTLREDEREAMFTFISAGDVQHLLKRNSDISDEAFRAWLENMECVYLEMLIDCQGNDVLVLGTDPEQEPKKRSIALIPAQAAEKNLDELMKTVRTQIRVASLDGELVAILFDTGDVSDMDRLSIRMLLDLAKGRTFDLSSKGTEVIPLLKHLDACGVRVLPFLDYPSDVIVANEDEFMESARKVEAGDSKAEACRAEGNKAVVKTDEAEGSKTAVKTEWVKPDEPEAIKAEPNIPVTEA